VLETATVSSKQKKQHGLVAGPWAVAHETPLRSRIIEWLRVKPPVNKASKPTPVGVHHDHPAPRAQCALGFPKEGLDIGDVVERILQQQCLQRSISERQAPCIKTEILNVGTVEIRLDDSFIEEIDNARTRTDFYDQPIARRHHVQHPPVDAQVVVAKVRIPEDALTQRLVARLGCDAA